MTTPGLLAAAAISVVACANSLAKPVDAHLQISDDGRYTLQGKPVALSELRARLLDLKTAHPGVEIHVHGSDKLSYAQVAPVMKLVEETGLAPRALILAPPDAPTSSVTRPSASGARR
jgi:biopolymer transport protein ExbD